jgi:hypothetical protein
MVFITDERSLNVGGRKMGNMAKSIFGKLKLRKYFIG